MRLKTMQSLRLQTQEELKNESKVVYLKPEYRAEVISSQRKSLKKVNIFKALVFSIVVLISLVNLFASLDGFYMLIGLSMVYSLFIFGMKAILHDHKIATNMTVRETPKKHKETSNEYIKLAKEYNKKYKRYKKDLNRYI